MRKSPVKIASTRVIPAEPRKRPDPPAPRDRNAPAAPSFRSGFCRKNSRPGEKTPGQLRQQARYSCRTEETPPDAAPPNCGTPEPEPRNHGPNRASGTRGSSPGSAGKTHTPVKKPQVKIASTRVIPAEPRKRTRFRMRHPGTTKPRNHGASQRGIITAAHSAT